MRRSSWSLSRMIAKFGGGVSSNKRRTAHSQKRRRFAFEPLEDRSLLSVCIWDGSGGALHTNWNTPDNWVNDAQSPEHITPLAGDELRFVGTAPNGGTVNDFPTGTVFSSIKFLADGFSLAGHDVTLTDGITVDSGITGSAISLNVALANTLTVDVAGAGDLLTISGVLSGSNYLKKAGPGTLALAGDNTYSGGTTIEGGTLKVESDDAFVECGNGLLVNGSTAMLDLNGHSITVGAVGLIDGSIHSATAATLTGSSYVVLNGTIDVGLGDNAATMMKGTSGVVTLSGQNAYSGLTTVYEGQLTFAGPNAWNPSVWNPIRDGAGADIRDGKLVLDYTDNTNSDPASAVLSILHTGYGDSPRFASAQLHIHSSTAAANSTALGWSDDATGHQVTIARTLYADATLDGAVNLADYGIVINNYNHAGGWAQGDFNYDGMIGLADYGYIINNYNHLLTGLPPQVVAIAALGFAETNSNTLEFAVLFSEDVTGVDPGDFRAPVTGDASAGTIAVSGSGAVYLVTVNNVSGDGTVGLNLIDDPNNPIRDTTGAALVGNETDNGSFTGEVYTVSSPFVWDGGGGDNYWSTPANWAGNVAPIDGSDLRFQGTVRSGTVDDFPAGTTFGTIEFASSGFSVSGEYPLKLTGGITMYTSVTDTTISSAIDLVNNIVLDFGDNATLTLNGDISGSGQIHAHNPNRINSGYYAEWYDHQDLLNLGGNNSNGFSGEFVVDGVTTCFTSTQAGSGQAIWWLQNPGDVLECSASGTVSLGSLNPTSHYGNGTLRASGNNNAVTFEIGGNNASSKFYGSIVDGSGTVALTKTGTGGLVLVGANTYTGGTTIGTGTLSVTGSILGDVTNYGTSFSLSCQDDATFTGVISGSGAFKKYGQGTLTLDGANT